jgi:hypothetical protein
MRRFPASVATAAILGAVAISLGLAGPGQATTLAPWTLEDFVAHANAAVAGTVTGVDVRWNDDHTQIHSYVTLDLDQVVIGETLPDPVVLDEFGGRVGRRIEVVEGAPVYQPGERVFVFVEKINGIYRTLGFYQGKYTLETDPDTGKELYVQRVPAGGVAVVTGGASLEPSGVSYPRQELIDRVRDIAGVR